MRITWTSATAIADGVLRQTGAVYEVGDELGAEFVTRGLAAPSPVVAPPIEITPARRPTAPAADEEE